MHRSFPGLRWSLILLLSLVSGCLAGNSCCAEGQYLVKGGCLKHGLSQRNMTEPYRLQCDDGFFLLDPQSSELDQFIVNDKDELVIGGDEQKKKLIMQPDRYCIGDFSRDNSVDTKKVALVCFVEVHEGRLYFFIRGICAVLSVVFLAITVACYIVLPELRDLQGKCMMCAVISLGLGFLFLGTVQLHGIYNAIEDTACVALATAIYIWMLSFFFWLNVVCFNLWRSVVTRSRRWEEPFLFLCYSAYAWGFPVLLAIIMLGLQYGPSDHKILGHESCFLSPGWSFVLFYSIIGIILVSNVIMYCMICWHLWRGMKEMVDIKRRSMKYKCCMYLKLFLIGGLTWIFEVASFLIETTNTWWLLTDIINGLQGVVMFLVLIALRPRAQRALAQRGFLCLKMPQRWRLRPDTELLHDDELDNDEDLHEEAARTITAENHNGH